LGHIAGIGPYRTTGTLQSEVPGLPPKYVGFTDFCVFHRGFDYVLEVAAIQVGCPGFITFFRLVEPVRFSTKPLMLPVNCFVIDVGLKLFKLYFGCAGASWMIDGNCLLILMDLMIAGQLRLTIRNIFDIFLKIFSKIDFNRIFNDVLSLNYKR